MSTQEKFGLALSRDEWEKLIETLDGYLKIADDMGLRTYTEDAHALRQKISEILNAYISEKVKNI